MKNRIAFVFVPYRLSGPGEVTMIVDEWNNCYPSQWRGKITPEAFKHPAKFSSLLIARIYQHAIDEGWLKPGDIIIDPFGGVALGAHDAMVNGMNWVGCELEGTFVELGNQNINLWNTRYAGKLPRWGSARLLHGDSRNLAQVVSDIVQAAISSPPYADGCSHTGGNDPHPEHIKGGDYYGVGMSGAISSPPYADSIHTASGIDPSKSKYIGGPHSQMNNDDPRYGKTPGQLGNLPSGNFDSVISSPPYAESNQNYQEGWKYIDSDKQINPRYSKNHDASYGAESGQLGNLSAGDFNAAISSPPFLQAQGGTNVNAEEGPLSDPRLIARHSAGNKSANAYGDSKGQISELPEGNFDAAISSPPFEQSNPEGGWQLLGKYAAEGRLTVKQAGGDAHKTYPSWSQDRETPYAPSEANLGSDQGETFWIAARKIIEQTYAVLAPGGHAIWVCKGYVKKGVLIDFPGQWRAMCEAVGFISLHEHHAMLVKRKGTSIALDGELIEHKIESKSFFRRIAERKGSPEINWETVLCMQKPE